MSHRIRRREDGGQQEGLCPAERRKEKLGAERKQQQRERIAKTSARAGACHSCCKSSRSTKRPSEKSVRISASSTVRTTIVAPGVTEMTPAWESTTPATTDSTEIERTVPCSQPEGPAATASSSPRTSRASEKPMSIATFGRGEIQSSGAHDKTATRGRSRDIHAGPAPNHPRQTARRPPSPSTRAAFSAGWPPGCQLLQLCTSSAGGSTRARAAPQTAQSNGIAVEPD